MVPAGMAALASAVVVAIAAGLFVVALLRARRRYRDGFGEMRELVGDDGPVIGEPPPALTDRTKERG